MCPAPGRGGAGGAEPEAALLSWEVPWRRLRPCPRCVLAVLLVSKAVTASVVHRAHQNPHRAQTYSLRDQRARNLPFNNLSTVGSVWGAGCRLEPFLCPSAPLRCLGAQGVEAGELLLNRNWKMKLAITASCPKCWGFLPTGRVP